MPNFISEDQIEQTLLQKLQHVHGYDVLDCHTEEREDLADGSRRASKREGCLLDRLRTAAIALNPGIPAMVIDGALEKLADRRQAMLPVPAMRAIIERYNAGGSSNENYFEELVKFTRDLRAEEERSAREGLNEDELEVFDLLKKEKMTQAEEQKVKLAAKSLLERLTNGKPKVLV